MKYLVSIFLLLMVAQSALAQNPPVEIEPPEGANDQHEERRGFYEIHNAFESMSLRISLDASLHGFIEGKICDDCETIRVKITPETKAYENNIEVPLKRAEARLGRYAAVMYLLKTKEVSAIRW